MFPEKVKDHDKLLVGTQTEMGERLKPFRKIVNSSVEMTLILSYTLLTRHSSTYVVMFLRLGLVSHQFKLTYSLSDLQDNVNRFNFESNNNFHLEKH